MNVGAFEPRKNQAALLPLAQKYKCYMVGEGPLRDDVKAQAKEICADAIHFAGECAGPEVYKYLSRARIMVHPSIYEGFPRVFAESLATGVPVVALRTTFPRLPPIPFIFLVEPEQLLDKVDDLLSNADLDAAVRDAKAYAKQNYQEANIFNAFMDAVDACLPRPSGWLFDIFKRAPRRQL